MSQAFIQKRIFDSKKHKELISLVYQKGSLRNGLVTQCRSFHRLKTLLKGSFIQHRKLY